MKKSAKSSAEGEKFINFINILESLCGSAAFLIGSTPGAAPVHRVQGLHCRFPFPTGDSEDVSIMEFGVRRKTP